MMLLVLVKLIMILLTEVSELLNGKEHTEKRMEQLYSPVFITFHSG